MDAPPISEVVFVQSPSDMSELWSKSQISEQRLYCQGDKVIVCVSAACLQLSIRQNRQNDNDKNVKKDNIPEQTSLDSSFDMHAGENEEEHVRRSVLHTEEKPTTRGSETKIDVTKLSSSMVNRYENEYIIYYNQPPPGQGQGWFSQGPPPGQGQGWAPQGPPPGQNQGWFSQGLPPGQTQGWFQPQPPAYERRFGTTHPRHSEYQSGPPLDYTPEKEDRNAFVRKVMIIVFIMLLFTSAFMATVLAIPAAKNFFRRFALIISLPCLIILILLSCFMPTAACARKPPTNYICLVVVTILQSLVCGATTSRYETPILLQAFLVTMLCVMVCVGLACTKFDFTKWLLFVIVITVALLGLVLVILVAQFVFGFYCKILMIVILVVFTILNVVMLIIELQMVIGGKSVELSEEDYALGAYMLYTSIIHLFLNLVQLMGLAR